MVKAGDILKFAEPVHCWDKQFLDKGGKYIVKKDVIDVDELNLHLEISNGGFGFGKFSQYADKPFEVIGNIFENGEN